MAHAQPPDLGNQASARDSARPKKSRMRVPTTPVPRPKSIVAYSSQALPVEPSKPEGIREATILDEYLKKRKMEDREPNFEANQNEEDNGPINLRIGVSRLGSSSAAKQPKKPTVPGSNEANTL